MSGYSQRKGPMRRREGSIGNELRKRIHNLRMRGVSDGSGGPIAVIIIGEV